MTSLPPSADRLDTPLTRLQADYDARLLLRDAVIADLRLRTEQAQMQLASVKGINQLLKLLLADMACGVEQIAKQLAGMATNITELRSKLPELD